MLNTHSYQAMYCNDGSYAGINEIVFTLKPWLDWYLQTTGQYLMGALLDLLPMRMQPLVHLAAVIITVEKLPQQTPILKHQHIDFDNWLSIVL